MATPPVPYASTYLLQFQAQHPNEYQRAYQFDRFSSLLKRFEKKGVIVTHLGPEERPFQISLEDFDDVKDAMKELAHDGGRFRYHYAYPILSFCYEPPQSISPLAVTTHLMEALLMIKDKLGVIPERVYEERDLPISNTITLRGGDTTSLIEQLKRTFPANSIGQMNCALITYDYKASSGSFRWKWELPMGQQQQKRATPDSAVEAPPAAKTIAAPQQGPADIPAPSAPPTIPGSNLLRILQKKN